MRDKQSTTWQTIKEADKGGRHCNNEQENFTDVRRLIILQTNRKPNIKRYNEQN